jgi:predicted nuclease with TOPRIM domain
MDADAQRRLESVGTHLKSRGRHSTGARPQHEALDREELLDRLHQLRMILPAFAQELAGVRRVAAQLRRDNRRLLEEVQRLRREERTGAPARSRR